MRLATSCDEGSEIGRQIKICLIKNLRIMKKLVLLMLFILSSMSLSANSLINNKIQIKKEPVTVENVPKATLCRYWAIIQANDFGDYGSQSWQIAYLYYFRSCMSEPV